MHRDAHPTTQGPMRTSPVKPCPGFLKTAAMLAVPFVLPIVLGAMLAYGWSPP